MTSPAQAGDFLEVLGERVILLDGAMGTEIYARGVFINRSYDEVNLTQPDIVRDIHASYLKAGADVLTTNTFGANRPRLQPHGLDGQLEEINRAAVKLAREVARDRAWVAGSIGRLGVRMRPFGPSSPGDSFQAFREQASILAEAGVHLFILETFGQLPELWQALRAVRSVCDLPVIPCMTFQRRGPGREQPDHETPAWAARSMASWKPTAIGTNCSNGPRDMLELIGEMVEVTDVPVAALPNAGLPQEVDGRTLYLAGPEYMAEYARRIVQRGASIVGGCCGTNPAITREMANFLKSIAPMRARPAAVVTAASAQPEQAREAKPVAERSRFAASLAEGSFCVSVELDPPRGVDPSRAVNGAALLREAGIDVVNIADGPRAVPRMGAPYLAQLVKQRHGIEPVVHVCCRDRNVLGLQMDLIGAHALGVRNILAVTGDPPKLGSYPDASAVFDIDAVGLIAFIQMLNRGLDFSGKPIGGQTSFFVGAGCNPGHIDLDLEVERYGRKVEVGAEFFFSQPVFEPEVLQRFLDRVDVFPRVPFLVGILPIVSSKNAEFLHNEVPGMQIPDQVRDRLRAAPTREEQREIGISVAQEALRAVKDDPRIQGAYIFPPFGSYRAVRRVLEALESE